VSEWWLVEQVGLMAARRERLSAMSIDANVAFVETKEDGSGTLHLCDRVPNGSRGQSRLHFDAAPHEVTALNGLPIWGGDSQIMLGDVEIAKRVGYTHISFNEREVFLGAVKQWHERRRNDAVCEHGVAMDVHCCGCHSGFLFDIQTCTCLNPPFEAEQ